jgi:hypothetical protein
MPAQKRPMTIFSVRTQIIKTNPSLRSGLVTCYTESPNSANVLTEIQDSFGDKIPVITAAMQPKVTFSQYVTEVADPLADVVMNNLLRMPMNFLYYSIPTS